MRADEIANEEEIRRSQGRDKFIKKGASLAIGAGTAALGAGIASKISPFLSEYIPLDIAMKGISKVSPKVGDFLKKGQSLGLDMKEGFDFIKENLSPKEEPKKQANPVQDFEINYPEIAQALANTMKQGQSPDAAAGILKTSSSFGKKVKELEKSVGKNFVDYVLELFGPQAGSMQQPKQMQQEQTQQQNQAGPQGVNIDQELMSALDKILKM